MPILAGAPVVQRPLDVPDLFNETRRLAFRSLDGQELLPFGGNEFFALWGAQGLEVPDRDVTEGTAPGVDGSFIDDVRIGSRKVLLPVYFGTQSGHVAHLGQKSYLRSFFNHRGVDLAVHDGTFDLVATSAIGERSLRSLYLAGLAGDWVVDSNGVAWQKAAFSLLACRTYWYGPRWETPVIRRPTGASWFGTFPPELSSSRAFGTNIPVIVEGDVESWARVDVTGPCDSLLVSADGLHISIPDGLSEGETARIDTDPRVRRNGQAVTFSGVEDWTRVAPDDVWGALSPGLQMIDLVLTGVADETEAVVSGDTRWETPW